MKIIIDCSNLRVGGGIQVALSFINDLIKIVIEEEIIILMSPQIAHSIKKLRFTPNFRLIEIHEDYYKNIFVRGRELYKIENEIKPNVIFTVFGPSYHKSKFPKIVGFAIPFIIYSNSPFFSKISLKEWLRYKFLGAVKSYFFKNNSDALIFETDDARNISIRKIDKKINMYTVGNTLNRIFIESEQWTYNVDVNKTEMDILCLSANYPHKNLDLIPKIIDEILILQPNLKFRFHITVKKNEFNFTKFHNQFVNYLGRVELEDLPHLYSKMDINFMPTLLEVFSTTYLEAMFMEVPIVCSDMSFARDICADSAIYCDPLNAAVYAKNLLKVKDNKNLKNTLIQNGKRNLKRFGTSMERTNQYLEIIKNTINH